MSFIIQNVKCGKFYCMLHVLCYFLGFGIAGGWKFTFPINGDGIGMWDFLKFGEWGFCNNNYWVMRTSGWFSLHCKMKQISLLFL